MCRYLPLIVLLVTAGAWQALAGPDTPEVPLDASAATAQAEALHDSTVHVRGIVASVCKDEGCFIDIVPLSGRGDGILVSARHGAFSFPKNSIGKEAVVEGTFYSKIYPFYRMDHWHHHGWRAGEKNIPAFARIFRIEADSVEFKQPVEARKIEETPLTPYASPLVDLDLAEFEAARMGTGKKCLSAGERTPEHSSGRYHELLFAVEGNVSVSMGGVPDEVSVAPGRACYIPPDTRHSVANHGSQNACYIFVYSLPETEQDRQHGAD